MGGAELVQLLVRLLDEVELWGVSISFILAMAVLNADWDD